MTDSRPRDEAELVELLHSIDVSAPAELHGRVRAMTAASASTGGAGRRRPLPLALGATAALIVVAAILLATLPGTGGLSVAGAASVALRPATLPAPGERGDGELTASAQGIPFPYWQERFGWRSVGARTDVLDGRAVTTVIYEDGEGRRVGYAIAAGPAPTLSGGTVRWREGVPYRLSRTNGAGVVAWVREGHLCVIAGHGVDAATLVALASWGQRPTSS